MMRSAVLILTLGFINAIAQTPAPQTPPGNAKTGQATYMKIGCYQCHGNDGQGGAAGPRLGPAPMLAYRAFANYVRAPRGEMPPYTAKVLSEQELADMYAYLVSVPRPPALNTIPLLQP